MHYYLNNLLIKLTFLSKHDFLLCVLLLVSQIYIMKEHTFIPRRDCIREDAGIKQESKEDWWQIEISDNNIFKLVSRDIIEVNFTSVHLCGPGFKIIT